MGDIQLKKKIGDNMEYLKKNTLRLKMLVSELVSCDLLSFDQADIILEQENHLTMHEKLYSFLMEEANPSGITKLMKALRSSGNSHIAELLLDK
ncbi:hypothetical protein Ocin01_09312 [Orchesella cincta]|uniref:CARD domain-containing protein n=1 Tax=Orchesella cincta TaxID=48709 RepID=A0A1D2MWN8_ORCCI|nr:hypothetical protein Ocin01_09312 [Orchesella cincta]